jgi:molecular chaperone DnaK (HSP70)
MSKNPVICIDISPSTAVAACPAEGETNFLTQLNIATYLPKEACDIRTEDFSGILGKIKEAAEHRLQGKIEEIMLSTPNHYTVVESTKLRDAAKGLGMNLIRRMTRAEALAVYHCANSKNETEFVLSVVNSPEQVDVHFAVYGDSVVDGIFVNSFTGFGQADISGLFKYTEEGLDDNTLFTVCLCDSYRNQELFDKIDSQCKAHLKNYRIIPYGEEKIAHGLCRYSEVLTGSAKGCLLIQTLPYSVGIQVNGETILTIEKGQPIPTVDSVIYKVPPAPVTISLACIQDVFGPRNSIIDSRPLPDELCGEETEFSVGFNSNMSFEYSYRKTADEAADENAHTEEEQEEAVDMTGVKRILGIDFGTSTSLIRVRAYENGEPVGKVESVEFEDGGTVPTLILHNKKYNETMVGYEAAHNSDQGGLLSNFKLDLASKDEETRKNALKNVGIFFKHLYETYDDQRTSIDPICNTETTYISYPVKWKKELRNEMKNIASSAGFQDVRGIDEASAAIHAVLVQQKDKIRQIDSDTVNILLIDMGAGTTDLALCKCTLGQREVEVLNTWPKDGNHALFGGREVDEALWGYVKKYLNDCGITNFPNEANNIASSKGWKEKTVARELLKHGTITSCGIAHTYLSNVGTEKPFPPMDRAVFEDLLEDYLRQFPDMVNGILHNTPQCRHEDVDMVVFAGGHSRWYFADEMIFGKMTRFGEINIPKIKAEPWRVIKLARPHETVALGMVYQPISVEVKRAAPKAEMKAKPKPERDVSDNYEALMVIEDVSTVIGRGTVVTGAIRNGAFNINDTAELCDASGNKHMDVTISGFELPHKDDAPVAKAGGVGLLLRGVSRDEVQSGYKLIKRNKSSSSGTALTFEDKLSEVQLATGASWNDCKNALNFTNNHKENAIEFLRTKGKGFSSSVQASDSQWRNISSQKEAEDYTGHLLNSLGLNSFPDSRNIMAHSGGFYDKLTGARTYARIDCGEYPLFIYDGTVFGSSAKTGFLATTKGIYTGWMGESAGKRNWADVTNIDNNGSLIPVSAANQTSLRVSGSTVKGQEQYSLLKRIWQDLR